MANKDLDTRTAPEGTDNASGIESLGYEQARDELASIVSQLEGGRVPLEESMRLWERGELLAAHCQRWLDGAQRRIDDAVAKRQGEGSDGSYDPASPETTSGVSSSEAD